MDRTGINVLPTALLALAFLLLGGLPALVWGYFVSTVLLWHGSFTINSLSHLFGKRRYATSDDSRNNWMLGPAGPGCPGGRGTEDHQPDHQHGPVTVAVPERARGEQGGGEQQRVDPDRPLKLTG